MSDLNHRLGSISCPKCNGLIESGTYTEKPPTVKKYHDCLRRCEDCGIGISNGKTPVVIFKDPLMNVPEQVRDGVLETLHAAINVQNRKNKLHAFSSANSEDAVTWTLISYLWKSGQLRSVLRKVGVDTPIGHLNEPKVLLWGAPVPDSQDHTDRLSSILTETIDSFEGKPNSRTEPDVVLDFADEGVVVIEVKYKSLNDKKVEAAEEWDKYLNNTHAFSDPACIKQSGLYELCRNWRVAWELSEGRPFYLINLGTKRTFSRTEQDRISLFTDGLNREQHGSFLCVEWVKILEVISVLPDWLAAYSNEKDIDKD